MTMNHNQASHVRLLSQLALFTLLILGLSSCSIFDGDGDPKPECYDYSDCEDDQICVTRGRDGEVTSYEFGECVSASICEEIPGLSEAIFDEYASNIPLELVDEATELRFCEAGVPLRCASDRDYYSCSRRDYHRDESEESGCFHYFSPFRPEAGQENIASCEGDTVCVDLESGASCVSSCSASSDCDAPETCQQPPSVSHFICGPSQPGPLVDSLCTVTVLEALVDGSDIEGTILNNPDLYVILRSGDFKDSTTVINGSERPIWNYSFTDLSYELISKMRLILMDDDEATLGLIPNLDDNVYEWLGPDNQEGWRLTSMEQSYELSGGPVSYLQVEISCQ